MVTLGLQMSVQQYFISWVTSKFVLNKLADVLVVETSNTKGLHVLCHNFLQHIFSAYE
jgi:hypothetical protein